MTQQRIQFVIDALRDKDWRNRVAAARFLAEIAADARPAIPALRETLRDENKVVREAAAKAIGTIGGHIPLGSADRIEAPELVEALKDEAWEVRVASLVALVNILHQESVPHLREALSDEHEKVRLLAGELLAVL